jgi:SAM-dependent methyltransferase
MNNTSFERLIKHRRVWQQKAVLRRIYQAEFFPRLHGNRAPGPRTLEVGGGPGFYKEFAPETISSDLIHCPWLDLALDSHYLPFPAGSLGNVVGLDILHHLAAPTRFLQEVARVLRPGGRLVLVEPWITPFSYLFYRHVHDEDCDTNWQPCASLPDDAAELDKNPFEANAAIPYLVFCQYRRDFSTRFPELALLKVEPFCLFAYLLSGGFQTFNLLPASIYPLLNRLEESTRPLWRWMAALRALIVLERREAGTRVVPEE